jgi:large subunit ribosomal protein L24
MKKTQDSPFSFPPLKKEDKVVILSGKDKGKSGKIIRVDRLKHRVYVENVNIMKKTTKPTQNAPQGGFIEKENFINASNVMLECPQCNKPTRVAHRILDSGKKLRSCKKCNEIIDKK